MRSLVFRIIAATVTVAGCNFAFAADDVVPGYAEETLSGDWNGLRTHWHRQGVSLDLAYKWDMLRIAQGGLRPGGRPIGHFDLRATGNLEKIFGWPGAGGFVNFIYDGGGKTNTDYLGSLLGVSNIEVPVSTARLFQAWVEQSYAGGSGALLVGLYPIDSEFQVVESAGLFVQPPYGAGPDIALTRGPSIFNNSAFGVRVKWELAELGVYAMGAALDGIPGDPEHPKGTHIRFEAGDGGMQIVEIGYRPSAAPASPSTELPESFAKLSLGFWRYTAKVDDLVDVGADGAAKLRRSTGWYALAEKTLWRRGASNLTGFIRLGGTDGDSTAIERFFNVGGRARGLFPGRADDLFGLAHTRGDISGKFRFSQVAVGIDASAAESATEITYRIQAAKWLAVQPLVQWYRYPGADRAVPDATVIGVRVEVAL